MTALNAGLVYIVSSPAGSFVVYGSDPRGDLGNSLDALVSKMNSGDVVEIRAYACEVSYEALRPSPEKRPD
jgi:hypothetical protein